MSDAQLPIEEPVVDALGHGNNSDAVLDQIDHLLDGTDEPEQTPDPVETEVAAEVEPDIPEKDEAEEPDESQEPEEEVEIDYDLMVPMADGRDAIKLGDMKDMVNEMERSKADIDAERMALIKQETEINQYVQQMGLEVPPDFQRYMADKQETHLREQHDLMMKMMPELKTPAVFNKMRTEIVDVAKASNFTEEEISKVADARIIHLLNRLSVLEAKELSAQETVQQIKKKTGPKGVVRRNVGKQSAVDKQYQDALGSSDQGVKDAAIAALIG